MFKKLILMVVTFVSFQVFADGGDHNHTPNYCSATNTKVCAHLGHMSSLNSRDEVTFVAHVMGAQQVTDMKVILWMPSMGHGSSPVKLEQTGVNHYQVTQAYFIMPGEWVVRLQFKLSGQAHEINIPLQVNDESFD